jgi:hypothetical protein
MQDELDKKKAQSFLGTDTTTGITVIDQDPNYIYIRQDASGNYVRIELSKDTTYNINHNQSGNEVLDFEINPDGGAISNEITINQRN